MRTFVVNTTLLTVSLQHVSALKRISSSSRSDTLQQQDQQNQLPDVKCSLASSVQYITSRNFLEADH
jgi:hypothetical protein